MTMQAAGMPLIKEKNGTRWMPGRHTSRIRDARQRTVRLAVSMILFTQAGNRKETVE